MIRSFVFFLDLRGFKILCRLFLFSKFKNTHNCPIIDQNTHVIVCRGYEMEICIYVEIPLVLATSWSLSETKLSVLMFPVFMQRCLCALIKATIYLM